MDRPLFSPYGPRPKRSAQIVLVWMAVFVGVLLLTYYLTRLRREGPPVVRPADEPPAGAGKLRSPKMKVVE